MDQVLCNLQEAHLQKKLSAWEIEFVESMSKQYANWQASTSQMSFGTSRQRNALLTVHRRLFPAVDPLTFQPFPKDES
jgi:hypothetical protein